MHATSCPSPAPAQLWSPYRTPLTRYLNVYAAEAVAYFLDITRLQNPSYFFRLLDIIRAPVGVPLLDALTAAPQRFASVMSPLPEGASPGLAKAAFEAQFYCLHLMWAVVKLRPDWLPRQLMELLLLRWRSPDRLERVRGESELSRPQLLESKRIALCVLNFVSRHHGDIAPLFDLLSVFTCPTRINFSFVKEFYAEDVAQGYTVPEKQAVVKHFLELFRTRGLPDDELTAGIKLLLCPVLAASFAAGQSEVLTPEDVRFLVLHMFDPPEAVFAAFPEHMRLELFKLATLLIQHAPKAMQEHRKELIKFGWFGLKHESPAKPYAFLCVAHFFNAFSTPEKIVLQVFCALARMVQPEAREIVRQALDVLTPTLAKRDAAGGKLKFEGMPAMFVDIPADVLHRLLYCRRGVAHVGQVP